MVNASVHVGETLDISRGAALSFGQTRLRRSGFRVCSSVVPWHGRAFTVISPMLRSRDAPAEVIRRSSRGNQRKALPS